MAAAPTTSPIFEVQASAFRRLQENQRVEFLVKEGRKGTQAGQIRPI